MIGNDKFVSVFGSVPAGDTSRLTQIVANAVREGFHIVLCAPGGDTPVCTLPVTHQKREHECGAAHVLSLESVIGERTKHDPWYLDQGIYLKPDDYSPKDKAKVRAKVQAIVNRVTKQHGDAPNIAVQPGPSGYVPVTHVPDQHNVAPTVRMGPWSWYWFRLPDGTTLPDKTSWILVPPSTVVKYGALQLIGQTNPAPAWLLNRIKAAS